jgi:hypothetical protein
MDASSNPAEVTAVKPVKRKPPGVLLFMPGPLNRTEVVQWLKRIHAWTGFWGALAFLLIGTSGMLLNHRSVLKIDTGGAQEMMSADIAVDPALIRSVEDLGKWAQTEFGTSLEPRAPRAEGGGGGQPRPETAGRQRVELMGREVQQAEVWRQSFNGPNGVLNVEYAPGSASVKASKSEQNAWGFLKNMHKGVGMSWVWVLFIDTMAGGLIAMSLTGALLWSRLHGPRLAAVGIVVASLGLALFAAWPSMV